MYDGLEIGRSAHRLLEAFLSGNSAGSNVTEPPAGSRRPVRGEWVLGPRRAAPRKGGDPADVYPYGDL